MLLKWGRAVPRRQWFDTTARKLDENLTATLKERVRREETTVQGALCAALALAGRKTSSTWRKQQVRVMPPVNARAYLGAGEACGLYLGGGHGSPSVR